MHHSEIEGHERGYHPQIKYFMILHDFRPSFHISSLRPKKQVVLQNNLFFSRKTGYSEKQSSAPVLFCKLSLSIILVLVLCVLTVIHTDVWKSFMTNGVFLKNWKPIKSFTECTTAVLLKA